MTIRTLLPSPGHMSTKFITIDSSRCQACWKCVETCPNHVLGKVMFLSHRHAHVDHAEACKGCKKCVRVCPNHAILYMVVPANHDLRYDQDNSAQTVATR